MQWDTTVKKLVDSRHDMKTATQTRAVAPDVVYPMGDYRFNEQSRTRKFENLLGVGPKAERREILKEEEEKPATDIETWESLREDTIQRISRDVEIAMKRDDSAWTDEDGYSQIKESPAFRDGFNTTLRVKPEQEAHLHNGLKQVKERDANVVLPEQATRALDQVRRALSTRADIAQLAGAYLMRGISKELGGKSRVMTKDGSRVQGEIALILRALEEMKIPEGYKAIGSEPVSQKRDEVLSKTLGSIFLNLGMTLPAGKRDDPLRNDSVALEIGNRIMFANSAGRTVPDSFEASNRKEVATAIGRAMLHLRAAAGIEASRSTAPIIDSEQKDRTLVKEIGRLTAHLLETSAPAFKEKKVLRPFKDDKVNSRPMLPSREVAPHLDRAQQIIDRRIRG